MTVLSILLEQLIHDKKNQVSIKLGLIVCREDPCLIKEERSTFSYLYDFGDSWEHELIVEENHYWVPEHQSDVMCLEGARACPPEDVGGIPGYYELCEGLKDPTHEEHEQFKELVGSDYDSEFLDIDEINVELMNYLRWSRDRFLNWLDK